MKKSQEIRPGIELINRSFLLAIHRFCRARIQLTGASKKVSNA